MIKFDNFSTAYQKKIVEFINSVNDSFNSPKKLTDVFFGQTINVPPSSPETDCYIASINNNVFGFLQIVEEPSVKRIVGLQTIRKESNFAEIFQNFLTISVRHATLTEAKVIHFQISQNDHESKQVLESSGWHKIKTYWNLRFEETHLEDLVLPDGYSLRHFVKGKDENTLTDLQNQSFGNHWGFSPNNIEQIRYRTQMERTNDKGIIFIEKNGEIAGYNWTMEAHHDASSVGWVAMTGVHPNYRGLRLGRAVVLAGMHYLKSKNISGIELEVDSENIPATRLYNSIGFRKINQTHWYEKSM
tara:strand:+ start:251 stop:1156 length:906 start_codon:yes stop_codon:yes gene_type:complete